MVPDQDPEAGRLRSSEGFREEPVLDLAPSGAGQELPLFPFEAPAAPQADPKVRPRAAPRSRAAPAGADTSEVTPAQRKLVFSRLDPEPHGSDDLVPLEEAFPPPRRRAGVSGRTIFLGAALLVFLLANIALLTLPSILQRAPDAPLRGALSQDPPASLPPPPKRAAPPAAAPAAAAPAAVSSLSTRAPPSHAAAASGGEAPSSRTSSASAGVRVQVGAAPSDALARSFLARASAAAPDLASGLTPEREPIRKDGRLLFRAILGGFPDAGAANAFCAKLQERGVACFIRR